MAFGVAHIAAASKPSRSTLSVFLFLSSTPSSAPPRLVWWYHSFMASDSDFNSPSSRAARALRSGAEVSHLLLFVSGSGQSLGHDLLYAGDLLGDLRDPHHRSALTLELELACPGWLAAFNSLRPPKTGSARSASLRLSPIDPSDPAPLRPFLSGEHGGASLIGALSTLDSFFGARSLRWSFQPHPEALDALWHGSWSPQRHPRPGREGLSESDWVASLEAQLEARLLTQDCPAAVSSRPTSSRSL